jgi:hypothetical protein
MCNFYITKKKAPTFIGTFFLFNHFVSNPNSNSIYNFIQNLISSPKRKICYIHHQQPNHTHDKPMTNYRIFL